MAYAGQRRILDADSHLMELPDFLDGAARRKRVALIVAAVAILALAAAFTAAIASHFQPQ